jgi:hypothetical protein
MISIWNHSDSSHPWRDSGAASAPGARDPRPGEDRASRRPENCWPRAQETPCAGARFAQILILPNTHVPVVVCRSAGIWTRGQLTVLGRPAAGGEPAHPAKRGTRLEATTDRAFLVSAGPPKVGAQRGLSILPGVRTGHLLVQTMASTAWALRFERVSATAQQLTARAVRRWLVLQALSPEPRKRSRRRVNDCAPRLQSARARPHRRRILHVATRGAFRAPG